jgi:purine-nucleoside phosphorylase
VTARPAPSPGVRPASPPPAALPGPGHLHAEAGATLVRTRTLLTPTVAVVLGSGLAEAVSVGLEGEARFAYESLPGFPPPSVPGHPGRLVVGRLHGVPAAVFLGRVHLYEGHGVHATTLIPRLAAALGARALVLTNASGSLDPALGPGLLLLIEDHLNFLGVNPLTGWRHPDGRPAFADLSRVYDPRLLDLAEEAARRAGVPVARGVYAAVPGPSYETPAECAFLARAGAKAVGMSTVPEAVAGAALGMTVLGISCLTNRAGSSATHEEVLEAARAGARGLTAILAGVVPALDAGTEEGVGSGETGREKGREPWTAT